MPDIPFLSVAFMDFEASSLAPDSWPIEVGLSWIDRNLKIQTYHSLIQPVPGLRSSVTGLIDCLLPPVLRITLQSRILMP